MKTVHVHGASKQSLIDIIKAQMIDVVVESNDEICTQEKVIEILAEANFGAKAIKALAPIITEEANSRFVNLGGR